MENNPPVFIDINIFPSHAKRTAIIAWTVVPFLKNADFYIYKKWDGGAEWELLNTAAAHGTTYADTDFVVRTKEFVPQYRILAVLNGKEYISPDIAVFSRTDRKAFGVAHNIIRAKYIQARQDGIPVLYYPAIKNGEMSSTLDELTGQRTKATCPDTNSTDPDADQNNDYGTFYAGGYYRPFITFVRFLGAKLQRETRLDEGIFDESVQRTSFLSFPPVRSGDLVVDVASDKRWLVGTSIQAEMVKGVIPVGYTAVLALQSYNQPCYSVPIPSNYSDMLRNLIWPIL